MQVYAGVVKDRVVSLPEDVHLDEGLRAEVRVSVPRQEPSEDLFEQGLVEAGLMKKSKPLLHTCLKRTAPRCRSRVNLYCR